MKTGDFQTRVRHWSVQWEMERTLPPELRNIKNGKFILRVALGSLTRDLRTQEGSLPPPLREALANLVDVLRIEIHYDLRSGPEEFWSAGDRAFERLIQALGDGVLPYQMQTKSPYPMRNL